MEKKFIIIDGDSFIHRAYHGYKTHNKYSDETNYAVKGFTSMVSKILNDVEFDYLAIVLDHQSDSFRKDLDPKYKANRPPKEESFLIQIEAIHNYIKSSGLPYFCHKGVEGDDVIGFLAKKAQSQKWLIDIYTGDKDIAQILDERTRLIDTRFNKTISLLNIEDVFGVKKPEQIIDYLALQGDKADNIEGIAGCGEKTALRIIEKYDIIENFINDDEINIFENIKSAVRNKTKTQNIINQVKENPEKILLAKKLTTIKTDLDIILTRGDIKPKYANFNAVNLKNIMSKYKLHKDYSLYNETKDWLNYSE